MPDKPKLPYDQEGVIALLSQAKKPLIYAGGGITAAKAEKELIALAEKLNISGYRQYYGKDSISRLSSLESWFGGNARKLCGGKNSVGM